MREFQRSICLGARSFRSCRRTLSIFPKIKLRPYPSQENGLLCDAEKLGETWRAVGGYLEDSMKKFDSYEQVKK